MEVSGFTGFLKFLKTNEFLLPLNFLKLENFHKIFETEKIIFGIEKKNYFFGKRKNFELILDLERFVSEIQEIHMKSENSELNQNFQNYSEASGKFWNLLYF